MSKPEIIPVEVPKEIRKIIKQNERILAMNEQIVTALSNPMMYVAQTGLTDDEMEEFFRANYG